MPMVLGWAGATRAVFDSLTLLSSVELVLPVMIGLLGIVSYA